MKGQDFGFEVICDRTNEDFLKEFFLLTKQIDNCKVGYSYSSGNKARVIIIALNDTYKVTVLAKILECFCTAFILVFKYKFFKDRIKIEGLTDGLDELLIKALCFFDKQVDEEIIRQEFLKLKGNKLYLESFFNFRLKVIRARYTELAGIINLNIINFIQSQTFVEFLKFLIASIEQTEKIVTIKTDNTGEIEYENLRGLNVLLFLIKESPKKIIVKTKDVCSEGVNLIVDLFEDRVEIK